MKKVTRLISILIMTVLIASPFISFATDEGTFDASGNNSTESASGEESVEGEPTEEEMGTPANNDTEATAQDIKSTTIDSDNLLSEPTEVTVVDSVEELSKESDAAYDNDAFFTIDASKKTTSVDLATDDVSENVSDILSGGSSTSQKQSEIVDTLEDSGLYRAEESGKNKVDVASKFAYQRLRLVAPQKTEINAYGATKAVYFGDSYLLSYDSIEAAAQAYDSLTAEYGSDAVFIDMPMKLNTGEKGWGTAYMGMDHQKTLAVNSGQVTVAVIDSGIQKSHPVFSGKTILQGRDFVNNDSDPADDNGHGTAVSGVIAESTPDNVRILPIKAMDSKGEGSLIDIVNAIQYAENSGAGIINLSLGGYLDEPSDMEYCDTLFGGYNALIVCASGNENKNLDDAGVMEFPGELRSTVCVGSITASKERSSFSNYGQAVDFAAPGSSIMLAKLGGSYGYNSGTSFASPYIAAAAALVKAGHNDFSKDQISAYLKTISEDMGDTGKDVYYGNGCPIFSAETEISADAPYSVSEGYVASKAITTAVFTWRMDRVPANGDTVTINGRIVTPKNNGDGTYSYVVSGLDPLRRYNLPVKVVDGSGKDKSNVLYIPVNTAYSLSSGCVISKATTTAVYNWRMDRDLAEGARVTINNRKINPVKNIDGTYSYKVSGLDPTRSYKLPVKVIDSKGRTISNTLNVPVSTAYRLSSGRVISNTSTTAVFNWRMDHEPKEGASVTINGRKVIPKKNSNGTYSYNVSGLSPVRSYKLPVKIIDSKGRTISNTLNIPVSTAYRLSSGKVASKTSTTAVFNWKMDRSLVRGERLTINNRKVNPTKNSDGTYSYNVSGLRHSVKYRLPVRVIDRNGKTISNVMYITVIT